MIDFLPQMLYGTWITIALALCSSIFALVLSLILVWFASSEIRLISFLARLYADVIRSVPELLIIFLIYYGSASMLTAFYGEYVEIGPFFSGVIALGLVFGAYAAEVIRGAINDIPRGQTEAGLAIGLNQVKTFMLIILPQVSRRALPGLGNLWLILVKETSLVSAIGLEELMRKSSIAAGVHHDPLTYYLVGAALYLLITTVSSTGLTVLEHRVNEHNFKGKRV